LTLKITFKDKSSKSQVSTTIL